MSPTPKPGVLDITAYVGGRAPAADAVETHKLSANESATGPSPDAIAAFESARTSLNIYPDGETHGLRAAIGEAYGLNPDRIVCGNGSGELLALLADAYLRPGDEVLFKSRKGPNRAITVGHAWEIIKTAARELGHNDRVATHSMRKTFARAIYDNSGHDLILTQRALGHRAVSSTSSYLESTDEEVTEAVLRFAGPAAVPGRSPGDVADQHASIEQRLA